ncbi:WhiB family transcriptional regulator [Embleya sp. NPDC059237]|uniref:WhiB family transcriptional regulator n=1 Tax=Embleya sp. NPDC059237 TaxID=3346784 RepID=UPI003682C69C
MSTATLTRSQPTPVMDQGRRCSKCDEVKPLRHFARLNAGYERRRRDCNTCRNKGANERRAAKTAQSLARSNARIREVLERFPRNTDAARELGVHWETARLWRQKLKRDPDVVLKPQRATLRPEEAHEPDPEPITPEPERPPKPRQPPAPPLAWRESAACRGHSPDLWYGGPDRPETNLPGSARRDYAANISEAKRVCGTCPVRDPCLAHALAHHEQGVWGGLTEDERKELQ